MTTWLVIVAVGVGSFLFRVGPMMLLHRKVLSDTGDRAIRNAGLAAVAALIAMSTQQAAHGSSLVPVLVAVGAGAVLVARRASMPRILVIGIALYAGAFVVIGWLGR